jgi:hypothetical protein
MLYKLSAGFAGCPDAVKFVSSNKNNLPMLLMCFLFSNFEVLQTADPETC